MTRRERTLAAFNNKKVDKVPFSLWGHFLKDEYIVDATKDTSLLSDVKEAQLRFVEETGVDFVKIMSDGLFRYPSEGFCDFNHVDDFSKIVKIGKDNPYIRGHATNVKNITSCSDDLVYIYNVFSPSMLFRIVNGQEAFMAAYKEAPQKMSDAFKRVGEATIYQVEAIMKESGADGIYYCVQNQDIDVISDEEYDKYFGEVDAHIMQCANEINDCSILHICGYEGKRNRVPYWNKYKSKIVHWATHVEGVSLAEGREIFKGRCILGGFANTKDGILYRGSEAEIKAEAQKIVQEAGAQGLVVGADCSLPFDISRSNLRYVGEALSTMKL